MELRNDLITVREAAKALGVCERTVFNYVRQGLLKAVKVGGIKKAGRVYIPKAEIERILRGDYGRAKVNAR
jgi:excisionase family DNA binding protein